MALPITPELQIEEDELLFRFVRAAGPGGQNVKLFYRPADDALASLGVILSLTSLEL